MHTHAYSVKHISIIIISSRFAISRSNRFTNKYNYALIKICNYFKNRMSVQVSTVIKLIDFAQTCMQSSYFN